MSVERYRSIEALRLAGARRLGQGWLYLGEGALSPDLECILVTDDDGDLNERGLAKGAVERGFTREGLDTDTLEDTFDCAKGLADPPPDELVRGVLRLLSRVRRLSPGPGIPAHALT
jgi:hypothetical protein